MSPHLRTIRTTVLTVLSCVALATLAVAESHAASCTPPKYPGSGYFTGKIRTTNVTCSYAKKFVVAYYKCRIRNGGADGRCRSRVYNFRCKETRNSIPTEIDARVTCNRGSQRIVHTYQQNIE
jgi:hypothetical protein